MNVFRGSFSIFWILMWNMYVVTRYSSNPDSIFLTYGIQWIINFVWKYENCSKYYKIIRNMINSWVLTFWHNFFVLELFLDCKFLQVFCYCIISACSNSITEVALIYNHVSKLWYYCTKKCHICNKIFFHITLFRNSKQHMFQRNQCSLRGRP